MILTRRKGASHSHYDNGSRRKGAHHLHIDNDSRRKGAHHLHIDNGSRRKGANHLHTDNGLLRKGAHHCHFFAPLLGNVCDFVVLMSVVFNYQNDECALLVNHTNEYLHVMMLDAVLGV